MSKLTHKLNEKFVGANCVRPRFGEVAKKENGITLIALIITIIVMLILTGVTLSITLGDNGLVNKAKEATTQTQVAMDRELLLSAVVGAIDEEGNFNSNNLNLPAGFTGSNGTYTSENGYTFTINENGEIAYVGGDGEVEESNHVDLNGRYYIDINNKSMYLEIKNHNKLITTSYDSSSNQSYSEEYDISIELNENEKTGIISYTWYHDNLDWNIYNEMDAVRSDEDSFVYVLITENNQIINKVLIFEGMVLFQDSNGIEFPLDGSYLNETADIKLEFEEGYQEVSHLYKSGDYWEERSISGDLYSYVKINNRYYTGNIETNMEVLDDMTTITYNGDTFIKQAN